MQNLEATNRTSAVSGQFYPAHKETLSRDVKTLLDDAKEFSKENIRAIIVPHAGYIYSAKTAAQAYKTLHKKYKNIFLIGSSHHVNIDGASIYALGNYETPLGEVKVNQEIVSKLLANKLFSYEKNAHTKEHTLEVQLPFLQTIYKDQVRIVPIIIATSNLETIQSIGELLKPYFNEENLFVISTDLSHFPNYENANIVDKNTLDGIVSNNMQRFIEAIQQNNTLGVNELHTSACGWSSVLTLQYLTQSKELSYELLDYTNSGDTQYGDKNRVVGYGAVRVYDKKKEESFLSGKEKQELLDIAKRSLYEATLHNKRIVVNENEVSPKLRERLGAFVTLYKDKNLRGCIGRFEPDQPLYSVVIDMAIAAAQQDPRFSKVSADELDNLELEISVLTPRKKIDSIDEIIIGKHGIYVQSGFKHGTYLPHVATQMNWNAKTFVEHCAKEKAQILPQDIERAQLFVYEAVVFGSK